MSALPRSALSSVTPFMLASSFTFSFVTSHFLTSDLSFVGHYPLLIIHFYKMSYSSIPGRQGGNTTTEFAVCAWVCAWAESPTCSDHSLTDFERSDGVGHPSWCTPVIYSDLWTDKLTMKCVPYAVPVITEIWTVALRDWGHLEWQLKFMHAGTVQSKDCLMYLCREH